MQYFFLCSAHHWGIVKDGYVAWFKKIEKRKVHLCLPQSGRYRIFSEIHNKTAPIDKITHSGVVSSEPQIEGEGQSCYPAFSLPVFHGWGACTAPTVHATKAPV